VKCGHEAGLGGVFAAGGGHFAGGGLRGGRPLFLNVIRWKSKNFWQDGKSCSTKQATRPGCGMFCRKDWTFCTGSTSWEYRTLTASRSLPPWNQPMFR
jgi:hypothetical protein